MLDHAWRANGHVVGALAGDLPPNHEPPERVTDFVPRLIELCFQTAGVWELGTAGRMALPTHVDRVTALRRRRRARAPVGRRHAAATAAIDAEVVDDSGRVRVRLEGYRTIELPGGDRRRRARADPHRDGRRADMQRPFRRLAIVNRGEPAMRVIHAVRELNEERAEPIRLIALYTEPERQAMFVRHADEAVCIGPALVGGDDGSRRSGYLDYPALERALVAARADAAWVGWGFVAEHPAVRRAVRAARDRVRRAGRRHHAAASATRSRPSGSPSRRACRSRPGAAARSRRPPTRSATRSASATR